MNAAPPADPNTSTGPVRSLLSRTATVSSIRATSTHAPFALDRLLFRHTTCFRTVCTSSLDFLRNVDDAATGIGRVQRRCTQVLEDFRVTPDLQVTLQEQSTGRAVEIDQVGVGGVRKVHQRERT